MLHVQFVRCTLCYMCDLCGAHCVTCAHIVLQVRFVPLCYMCGLCGAHCITCGAHCVTCAHIVLHVRFVRVTCVTHAICEGHIVLHVRFYASHVLYPNECFGIVKIRFPLLLIYGKFDIKTFVWTH